MEITEALVLKLTTITWILGGLSVPVAFFGWAFGGGLFKPVPDVLPRGTVHFYLFTGAILVLFASAFIGSSSCLAGLIQLRKELCPMLHSRRSDSNYPYYLMTVCSAGMVFLWSWLVFRKPRRLNRRR